MNAISAQVLLHYYVTLDDYPHTSESSKQAIRFLVREDLLSTIHEITPRGRCLINHWLTSPLPVLTKSWSMPCGLL